METSNIKIRREFAMANLETFKCPPIRSFVDYYLRQNKVSVDPFAMNFTGCTYTNDLNPNTLAEHHMTALDFLKMLYDKGVVADLVVFDPPYTIQQVKEVYGSVGLEFLQRDAQNVGGWYLEKNIISKIMRPTGIFLHFGYHTNGMGLKRGFTIEEILIVSHGRCHNDTLCMAERRTSEQIELFPFNHRIERTQKACAAHP